MRQTSGTNNQREMEFSVTDFRRIAEQARLQHEAKKAVAAGDNQKQEAARQKQLDDEVNVS